MIAKRIDTGYEPRPLQDYIHGALKRFNVLVCHRAFGKTIFSINELVDQGLRCKWQNPSYAYIAPTYSQAEKIAWDVLKTYTKNLPNVTFNETKLTCTIDRPERGDKIKIMLLGSENPDSIRGMHLNGVVLDEYAQMNPIVWGQIVRPALSSKKGFAIFIGTPKGQNQFYEIYKTGLANLSKDWFVAVFKASQTKVLPPEEIESMKEGMSDDEIEQELECSFTAAITGAYWGKQLQEVFSSGRVTKVPHDPALQVETFWDLGVNDTTAIWFIQQHRFEVRVIDYFEMAGEGIDYYAKILRAGHRLDYDYKMHHWPHDGNSRDLTTGVERSTTARNKGIKPLIVHPRYTPADGIDAARRLFSKCYFDSEKCLSTSGREHSGLDALKSYQKKWDPKNKMFMDSPLHNWASNGADAWRLVAMALKPDRTKERSQLPRTSVHEYDVLK